MLLIKLFSHCGMSCKESSYDYRLLCDICIHDIYTNTNETEKNNTGDRKGKKAAHKLARIVSVTKAFEQEF